MEIFSEGGVSCFGKALPLDSHDGWFDIGDIGEYREKISFIPQMHGGIIFFKGDETTKKIYREALHIAKNYERYKFKYFDKPADEPLLALAMAVYQCYPVETDSCDENKMFVFYPTAKSVKCSITNGFLAYTTNCKEWHEKVLLLHWQNVFTKTPAYRLEELRLKYITLHPFFRELCSRAGWITKYIECLAERVTHGVKRRIAFMWR